MYCGTAPCLLEAGPGVQLSGLNSKICKNQPTYKNRIKCYKTNVCRLPSYMAHVLHKLIYFNMLIDVCSIYSI